MSARKSAGTCFTNVAMLMRPSSTGTNSGQLSNCRGQQSTWRCAVDKLTIQGQDDGKAACKIADKSSADLNLLSPLRVACQRHNNDNKPTVLQDHLSNLSFLSSSGLNLELAPSSKHERGN